VNDIDTKLVALIRESVDSQLGTRRPAPPFRQVRSPMAGDGQATRIGSGQATRIRSWLIPMLAAASIVGVIAATFGLTRLSSARSPVRSLATTAFPLASSAPAIPSGSSMSSPKSPLSTTGETTAGTPGSSTLTRGPSFSAIDGYYYGSTGSSGDLFIRADGASRFTGLDFTACPRCSTATAPSDTIDFSLTALIPLTSPGGYRAEGTITAGSDPADAIKLAGPVGSKVVVLIAVDGSLRLSFLPSTDVLRRAPQD
jgi:hypothetical protein